MKTISKEELKKFYYYKRDNLGDITHGRKRVGLSKECPYTYKEAMKGNLRKEIKDA